MDELKQLGLNGQLTKLDSTPPEGSTPASVMTMEAFVDTKQQDLKKIRPYYDSSKYIPTTLKAEAQIVLHALLACFENKKSIEEGLIGDLLWGFEQGGIPAGTTAMGLQFLEKDGYVKFQAKDNTFVSFMSDKIEGAWVRYQPKLLDMVYSK